MSSHPDSRPGVSGPGFWSALNVTGTTAEAVPDADSKDLRVHGEREVGDPILDRLRLQRLEIVRLDPTPSPTGSPISSQFESRIPSTGRRGEERTSARAEHPAVAPVRHGEGDDARLDAVEIDHDVRRALLRFLALSLRAAVCARHHRPPASPARETWLPSTRRARRHPSGAGRGTGTDPFGKSEVEVVAVHDGIEDAVGNEVEVLPFRIERRPRIPEIGASDSRDSCPDEAWYRQMQLVRRELGYP